MAERLSGWGLENDIRRLIGWTDIQADHVWRRYKNHPCWKMWRFAQSELCDYGLTICNEWIGRGCNDTTKWKFEAVKPYLVDNEFNYPLIWINYDPLFAGQRSNLIRKKPEFYKLHGWNEPDNLEYIWVDNGEGLM